MTDRSRTSPHSFSGPLPREEANPATRTHGTTPGSFARTPAIGTPYTFSSPDTPGMPAPSDKTAWDFMPPDWREEGGVWPAPDGFEPVTQLEHARLGQITPEMQRVAEREPHLTAEQVRDEVAAGRMVIPANTRPPGPSARPHGASAAPRSRRSTPTWAPRRCRAAPTKRSRSCAGPSAGAPTP